MEVDVQRIEITVSVTGKIPRRNFENFQPIFAVKEICGPMSDEMRLARQAEIFAQCQGQFEKVRANIRVEELQDLLRNLRFTVNPATGKKYPHVTDILYWDADFYIQPDELAQYGARGSAIHAMIDYWIASKEWDRAVINKRDKILLETGSLRLWDTIDDINFLGFMEKYEKDFVFGTGEFRAFNDEHYYCGQPDRVGTYKGRPAIFDWKTRAAKADDFKQMAMYLYLDHPELKKIRDQKGVMVVCPLNADNKAGYGRPVVSDEIDKNFNLALRDRQDFRDKFGI